MNYCTDAVTKGNPYKVYRGKTFIDTYSGLIERVTDSGLPTYWIF